MEGGAGNDHGLTVWGWVGGCAALVREIRRKVPGEAVSSLLDLLRICSVETVEAIAKWREAAATVGQPASQPAAASGPAIQQCLPA